MNLELTLLHLLKDSYVDKPTADKYNLKHVDDMKSAKIAKLFADPEAPGKGRMTSCISGWTCYTINLVKHKVYGLDEFYTNFDPGFRWSFGCRNSWCI